MTSTDRAWSLARRALLALVAVVSLLALARNGDSDGNGDGGPLSREEAEALLTLMVLQPDQVPLGLAETERRFTDNQTISSADPDPDAQLAKLEEQGRILSHGVFYAPATEAPINGLQSTVTLFETAAGAGESFAEAADEARTTDWAALLSFENQETEEIERTDLADQVVWIRNTGLEPQAPGDDPLFVASDDIVMRHDRTRAFLRVLSMPDSDDPASNLDQIAELARLVIANIEAALAGEDSAGS